MSSITVNPSMKITGKHVLFALLGFFGTVIAVNVFFVFLALDTWTGLTTKSSYKEGLAYNEAIRKAETQRALGWDAGVTIERDPSMPGSVAVSVTLLDAMGAPMSVPEVMLLFRHPMNEKLDRSVPLTRSEPGIYRGTAALPTAGNWDTRLFATAPDGTLFRQDGAVWIK